MVNLAREPLHGEVELDETWVGDTQAVLRGSRQIKGREAPRSSPHWRKAREQPDAYAWRSLRISKAQL
jgi:hypothetical protein